MKIFKGWISFLAGRYLKSQRKNRGMAPALFSILGIGIGGMALIGVLSVMNGFQLGFIEDIMEISSSHIRIESPGGPLSPEILEELNKIPGLVYLGPGLESQSLVRGNYPRPRGALVKGIPNDIWAEDIGFSEHVELISGSKSLGGVSEVMIGTEFSRAVGIGVGDPISLVSLTGEDFDISSPNEMEMIVVGLFNTGYYEFDSAMLLMSIDNARDFLGESEPLLYYLKLKDPDRAHFLVPRIQEIVGNGAIVKSWQEFNTAFYSALRMEKITMMVLVGLIFFVVGLNIFHSLERSILERKEELGLLKALGATTKQVQVIFLLEGALIGLFGGLLGMGLGLLVAGNVNGILQGIEWVANSLSRLFSGNAVELYSGSSFYLPSIPSRILPEEVALVVFFGLAASVLAAWVASQKVLGIRSAQVLRAE